MGISVVTQLFGAIGAVLKPIGKAFAWRLVKWGVYIAASVFAGKYKPETHAKKSRRWEWNKYALPAINKAKESKTPIDDTALAYAYYHQAWYIEDGTLPELIRRASVAIRRPTGDGIADALDLLGQASRLIEMPDNDGGI